MSFNTPILLLTFTRLDTTIKVFERIKDLKPKVLFLASDGPRLKRPDDIEKISVVREYIMKNIDWDCEIETLFRDKNLGCGRSVSNAISWFFTHVDMGIILEDDCVPLDDFFQFSEEMLHRYKNDKKVFSINGTNLQQGNRRGKGSYYFSRFPDIWGWATWARAWSYYDFDVPVYNNISSLPIDAKQRRYWLKIFKNLYKFDTWDYQWVFAVLNNKALCIVPNKNLVLNIGFNSVGTHTTNEPSWYKNLTSGNNKIFPLENIEEKVIDVKADNFRFYQALHLSLRKRTYYFFTLKIKSLLKIFND